MLASSLRCSVAAALLVFIGCDDVDSSHLPTMDLAGMPDTSVPVDMMAARDAVEAAIAGGAAEHG